MIKAEVITHPGAEVPNWLTKCRDVLVSPPAIGVVALGLVALVGIAIWNHDKPAYSDVTQSHPDTSLQLPVQSSAPQTVQSNVNMLTPTVPVGPAPSNSLQSLQPTGATQNSVGGLTQASDRTTQAAPQANQALLRNMGL